MVKNGYKSDVKFKTEIQNYIKDLPTRIQIVIKFSRQKKIEANLLKFAENFLRGPI